MEEKFTGQFTMNVTLGNDSMADADELADVLVQVSQQVRRGDIGNPVMDVNGNTVGEWSLSVEHACDVCGKYHDDEDPVAHSYYTWVYSEDNYDKSPDGLSAYRAGHAQAIRERTS